jgi:hypothetical protein
MTWRDAVMLILVWIAIGLIAGPFIGKAIKTMRGDKE